MKIAYVGNFTQQHCTEVHLALTLEKLGHEVTRIQESTGREPRDWVTQVKGHDLFLYTRTWGNMVEMADLELIRQWGIPSASYHLDLYVGLKREDGLDDDPFWRTDYVFTPDGSPEASAVFKAKSINHFYMKPGVFEDECYMAARDGGVKHTVLFVGGGSATGEGPQYGHTEWPYRGQLIKFLKDTYRQRFSKFGWPDPTIRNAELNQLYADTNIVVGDSLCLNFTRPYYWSDRVCETLGRGGFMIHPYIKGMEEEFTDGEHLVYYEYNDWDGLKEKIDYYLEHPDERERIRRAGHERVKEVATYTHRLDLMLSIIFPVPDKPEPGPDAVPTPSSGPESGLQISLGAGSEPEEGFVNVDMVELPGIDVVHNLSKYPWPFEDDAASYIKAKDVIEHMPNYTDDGRPGVIAFIEECHRILQPGGRIWIQTPHWQSKYLWIDPTHVRGFDEQSFDFFDPDTDFGRATGFYSPAKFSVGATRTENDNLIVSMVKL
jgi:SAM-dependent methyltransferase